MDAIILQRSHIRNYPTKTHNHHIFPPNNFHKMVGYIQAPPPFLSHNSYPSYNTNYLQQPPLLPLPAAVPRRSTAASRKTNRIRKGSKPKLKSTKKELEKNNNQIENMYSGSVVCSVSPPPSSLPLPTFSLRPKMISCNFEVAAGIDAGATDNLRRLLRIR